MLTPLELISSGINGFEPDLSGSLTFEDKNFLGLGQKLAVLVSKKESNGGLGNLLLIYICNFHFLSNLLLIYICQLHWRARSEGDFSPYRFVLVSFSFC